LSSPKGIGFWLVPRLATPNKKHVFHRNFFFCNISHHPAFI